jgi:hypothetical protein
VNLQQLRHRFRWAAAEAAFGGDAEVRDVARRDLGATATPFESVRDMDQSEIELGFRV